MTKLHAIAAEMTAKGNAHRTLGSGLELVYQQQGARRRLALGREKVWPFDAEIDACTDAFAVPPEAALRRVQIMRTHPKTRRQVLYFVAELTWLHRPTPEQEADAAQAVVAPAPARGDHA